MIITYVLYGLASLLVLFSIIPMVRSDHWTFRIFEYPRVQKLVLTLIVLIVLCFFPHGHYSYWIVFGLLVVNTGYLLSQIYPLLPLAGKQLQDSAYDNPDRQISILVANVYQENDNTDGCLRLVKQTDPDIILLVETNKKWEQGTISLEETHPHHIRIPLENTYGILLYSKLTIVDGAVKYLVKNDVPSVECKFLLPSGELVQFYGLHPEPPVPSENPRSTERDQELLLIAEKAKAAALPVIVVGDLNDVGWSYTTELFLKTSSLCDPRRGRGFFNTFHAKKALMRFPLDYAFVSKDFSLVDIKRTDNFDSDHFSIFVKLQYEPENKDKNEALPADEYDIELANKKKNAI